MVVFTFSIKEVSFLDNWVVLMGGNRTTDIGVKDFLIRFILITVVWNLGVYFYSIREIINIFN